MTIRQVKVFFFTIAAIAAVGCKPTVPSKYISPDEMEDVLYDYYMSQAMANMDAKDGRMEYNRRTYFLAVLKKHDLTEAQFDSSMVYYYRRADYLRKIYARLEDRINAEAEGTAASSQRRRFISSIDTADIWRDKKAFMLVPSVPYNRFDFEVKADTSFRKGDTYLLSFDTNFIYQSGSKDAVLYLAVRYDNDSVASYSQNVMSSGYTQMRVVPNNEHAVRDFRGFVYLDKGRDESSTLKLMFLKNIQMLRMRKQKDKESAPKRDSTELKRPNIPAKAPDSISKLEGNLPKRPSAMDNADLKIKKVNDN